jgi:H+/Cl- antiporter ClcA
MSFVETQGVELMDDSLQSPWSGISKNNSETKTDNITKDTEELNTLSGHQLTPSTQIHQRAVGRLKKLGADVNDVDENWIRLQAKTAMEEERRRTSGFTTFAPTTQSSNAIGAHHNPSKYEHGDVYHPPHHSFSEVEKQLMNQYESLDYDIVNSELSEKELSNRTYWTVKCDWISKWFIFGLIGACTGTLAAFTALAVEGINEYKFATALSYLRNGDTVSSYLFFVLISVGFGIVATVLVNLVEPVAAGSGIPQLKAYLNGTSYARLLQMKTLVVKLTGVIFSVCAGLIIGKEGPMVHSGAVLGANISHLPGCRKCVGRKRWLMRFRNDRDKRDFVSGGTAAGVAAAFGAPVGGVLFALEEAASHWSIQLTWMVFFCSMIGTFTLNLWKVAFEPNASFGGLISFGPASEHPYKVWETPLFLLCGLIGGIFGALFNELNSKINHYRRDHCTGKPILKIIEVIVIVIITTSFQFWLPSWFETCQRIPVKWNTTQQASALGSNPNQFYVSYRCNETEYNDMATTTFAGSDTIIRGFFHNDGYYHLGGLVVYFFISFLISNATYGISVPSGLFVPCILMGCSFGRFYGEILRLYVLPEGGVVPGTYALMGAVGMLGGVSRMTISLSVILMETTQNVQFLLPIMMILLISKWVGDLFNISLYDLHVEIQCMPFVEASPPLGMENMVAVQVASGVVRGNDNELVSHVKTIRQKMKLKELLSLLTTSVSV